MSVPRLIRLSTRLISAFMLGVAVLLCSDAPFAAEGPTLPPAEYKPLPVGTKVKYDTWEYTVKKSDGFKTVIQTIKTNDWLITYGVFVMEGNSALTLTGGEIFNAELDEQNRSFVKNLWSLEVGKKIKLNFNEKWKGTVKRNWQVTLDVLRTELLELNGTQYPTFVVREHASTPSYAGWSRLYSALEYSQTFWYHPGSGLILKSSREWIKEPAEGPVRIGDYSLVSVKFPEGTTTHSLKGVQQATPIVAEVPSSQTNAQDAPAWAGKTWEMEDGKSWWKIKLNVASNGKSFEAQVFPYNKGVEYFFCNGSIGERGKVAESHDCDISGKSVSGSIYDLIIAHHGSHKASFHNNKLEALVLPDGPTLEQASRQAEAEFNLIKKVRKTKFYKYVGKGKITLSPKAKEKLKRFDDHAKSALFFVTKDGQHSYYTYCGTGCSEWGDVKEVKKKCEISSKIPKGEECFLYKIGFNAEGNEVGRFREKVVWDFSYKFKAQQVAEAKRKKGSEEKQRLAALEKKKNEEAARRKADEEKRRLAALEKKKNEEATRRKADEEKRRLAALEKKKNEEAARRKAAELKRKKEAEEKRRLAALEKKKKEEAVRRKAEAEKKKKARLAAKASAGGKDGGARSTLKERMATLKDLKEAGLLSEEEFKANKRAVLNEFLGLGGASKAASQNAPARKAKPSKYADVKFGKYYALVIGNNDYKHLPKLKTAAKDAKAVAKTLRDTFGFEVKTLINATRVQILDAFDDYEGKLGKTDNLLLYYAGHGWLDKEREQGYWLPVDAKSSRRSQWIPNSTITDALKAFRAKHVMVVADSCFSGTLTRGLKVEKRIVDYVREVVGKKARVALTSGGLEPVEDGGGGKNSPFATAFLKVLNGAGEVLTGTDLFKRVKRPVQVNADQTPNYADIRKAGHDGGDFLFVRTR